MKSLIVALVLSIPIYQQAHAQAGLVELRLNVGYGFNAATSTVVSDNGNTLTVIPYSLGSGLNVDLGATYMFGDHLGFGLDLSDVMSMPVTYTSYRGAKQDIQVTNSYMGGLYSITPMLVLSAHHLDEINPYGKFGMVIGDAMITYEGTESGPNSRAGKYIDVYSGNVALGVYAAFGLAIPIGTNLRLNLEAFDRTLSYAPGKVTNTQAYDGDKQLNTLTYVDSKNSSSASDTELKSFWPFSSVGLKVGIALLLTSSTK